MMNVNDINALIDNLAKKFEVPANKLMELAPQLGAIEAINTCILLLVGIFLGSIVLFYTYMVYKHKELMDGENPISTLLFILIMISGGSSIICIILTFINLPSVLVWFYNPQLWLLKYALDILH